MNDHYWVTHPDVGTFVAADETRWGWMVGAGIEYAFAANWSAKVEYDYLGLGTRSLLLVGTIPGQPPFDEDIRQSIQLA